MRTPYFLKLEAERGSLTDEELEYVATMLKDFDPKECTYEFLGSMLNIIRLSDRKAVLEGKMKQPRAIKYKSIIERYLYFPQKSYYSSRALGILCQKTWNFTEEYLDTVVSFLKGVKWDFFKTCYAVSYMILGEYLLEKQQSGFTQKEEELLKLVEEVSQNPNSPFFGIPGALGRLRGVSYEEAYPIFDLFELKIYFEP